MHRAAATARAATACTAAQTSANEPAATVRRAVWAGS